MTEQVQQPEEQFEEPIIEEMNDGSIIYLDEVITAETINPIVQYIITQNIINPKSSHITIFIDSDGGCIRAASKLIDVMNLSRIPIRTVGWGVVASAALLIFMCGHQRIISENAEVLSHQATLNVSSLSAKINDFESQQKEFQNICDRILRIYVEKTGKSVKEVQKKLMRHHDVWLTGREALEYGFADSLLNDHIGEFWNMLGGRLDSMEEDDIETEVCQHA